MKLTMRRQSEPGRNGPRAVSVPAYVAGVFLVGCPLIAITIFSFLQRGNFGSGVIHKFTADADRTVFFETDLVGNKSFISRT